MLKFSTICFFNFRPHILHMAVKRIIRKTWLSQKPHLRGYYTAVFSSFLLIFGTFIFLHDWLHADAWMKASGNLVYGKKEFFRAWTTLFAHSDMGHVLSNLFLFFPFAYLLSGYYGLLFFPLVAFISGGLINLVVLKTMAPEISLIGVSAVVHFMGAAWITLYLFIDRKDSVKRRILKAIGVSAILFLPQTYRPEVSYISHFVGYFFGVIAGSVYFFLNRKKLRQAEVSEDVIEDEDEFTDSASAPENFS